MKTPLRQPTTDRRSILERLGVDAFADHLTTTRTTIDGRWLHWDKLRHLSPPAGLDGESWWFFVKMAREYVLDDVELTDEDGRPFRLAIPSVMLEMLQSIDSRTTGRIGAAERISDHHARRSWLVSSLTEEAIRSSQLEGASTSRVVAKEMLRSGRPARTRSERMISNNYRAMNFVREHQAETLTVGMIRRLHIIVTEGTLADPEDAGRLQSPGEDRIQIVDEQEEILHRPPPAEHLPERLDQLCAFANGHETGGHFLHPVLRSVLVHFWLAYDHPFVDGNGRTARALFYWSMLHRGYWLTEFLSISAILRAAPSRYARSFLYTEMDDRDLTYFTLHHLNVILRAIDGLEGYLDRKMTELGRARQLLRDGDFNHRQAALLQHAIRHPHAEYTYRGHASSHGVAVTSARTDLLDLAQRGLLDQQRIGRTYHFFPKRDLPERLDQS